MSVGIVSWGVYLPYWRLQRSAIGLTLGIAVGPGHPEPSPPTTRTPRRWRVEAGRLALRGAPGRLAPADLVFSTPAPAYLDKTNATAVHAGLGLPSSTGAYDSLGSVRSAVGALRTARADGRTPVAGRLAIAVRPAHRVRPARPRSATAATAPPRSCSATATTSWPRPSASASATEEFLDRWRTVGESASRTWEERFGEEVYVPLVEQAFAEATKAADLAADAIDHVIVAGLHPRAVKAAAGALGVRREAVVDDHAAAVGNLGAAQPGFLLADVLDRAEPGQVIALVVVADGADVLLLRTTGALPGRGQPGPPPACRRSPNRSPPAATTCRTHGSSPGAASSDATRHAVPIPSGRARRRCGGRSEWRGGFDASRCLACGFRHLPPTRVCLNCKAIDQMELERLADVPATIATFTIDRLAFSLSPPVVGVVIDFEGGGRYRCQMTDVDPDAVAIGDPVEMTFRLLYTAGGVHNYFWKARPATARGEGRLMSSNGIRDQVAIVGMGCTVFGERWDQGVDDLLTDATKDAIASAGVALDDIDAFWLGTLGSGVSGITLSRPLKIDYKPVSRLENFCATGSEAFRNACYAVASGAYDLAMAIGVEKLKDTGYSGLTGIRPVGDGTDPQLSSPAAFSFLAPSYAHKYGVDPTELKEVMTRIAWKNHRNGAVNPRAQFRKEVPLETISRSPRVAGDLGVYDCSGVSDGSAAAIICRAEDAHRYCENPLYVKALSFVAGPAAGPIDPDYDYTTFPEVVASAVDAYRQAGIESPRERAGHGRGARLLHADRAGADGGPRVLRARPRLEGRARRHVRPRRRDADQPRRRAEVVRPSDRRVGPADAVRVLAAAARRGAARAPDRNGRPTAARWASPTTSAARRGSA